VCKGRSVESKKVIIIGVRRQKVRSNA